MDKTRFVYRLFTTPRRCTETSRLTTFCIVSVSTNGFDEIETSLPKFIFHRGLPSSQLVDEFMAERRHRIVVLDDLMHKPSRDVDMELLFTQGCHHRKLSVICLTQILFSRGSKARSIALNTYYLVIMRNARDASQAATFGRQLFPNNGKTLTEAMDDATSYPYGYLIVDTSPNVPTLNTDSELACSREKNQSCIRCENRTKRSVVESVVSRS